jgi:DNA-binding NtrC family response regulator
MSKPNFLLLSRDKSLRSQVRAVVKNLPRACLQTAATAADARALLSDDCLAAVLAHLVEPGERDEIADLMRTIAAVGRPMAMLVIGESDVGETGLALVRGRAAHFVERPLDLRYLSQVLDALTWRAAEKWPAAPASEFSSSPPDRALVETVGSGNSYLYSPSAPMGLLIDQIRQVAPIDTTILLQGETGTGKTLLAGVIHHLSPRRAAPFRVVDCAALSAPLIESELFGHVQGAFTGADRERVGKFAEVGLGTLFLDEVDALPPESQAKLLRVVEDRVFEAVGGNRSVPMRARLIAASNRNLAKEAAAGRFRADLFYRLDVISFRLPALREQPVATLDALVDQFIGEFAARTGREIAGVTPEARLAIRGYDWPGNVRELRYAVQRAVALGTGESVELVDFPDPIRMAAASHPGCRDQEHVAQC